MAEFEAHYPDEEDPTLSLAPEICPATSGTKRARKRGVVTQVLADEATLVSDRIGPPVDIWDVVLLLKAAELPDFDEFMDRVGARPFRMKHPLFGGFLTVQREGDQIEDVATPLGKGREFIVPFSVRRVGSAVTEATMVVAAGTVDVEGPLDAGDSVPIAFASPLESEDYAAEITQEELTSDDPQVPVRSANKTAEGFDLVLQGALDADETIRFGYIARVVTA